MTIDRSIVVAVICLFLIGGSVYYFNSKIAILERSIIKQNQVLADFITNVKGNLMSSQEVGCDDVYKPPSLDKIDVSDSEDSSECDTDVEICDKIVAQHKVADDHIVSSGLIDITDFGVVIIQTGEYTQTTSGPDIVEVYDDKQLNLGDLEQLDDVDSNIDFKKMKLTQLKDIALSKGIDTKGKKRNELVETLTKH